MDLSVIEITKDEYDSLRDNSRLLQCLQNSGVDNWEWYEEALKEYHLGEEG